VGHGLFNSTIPSKLEVVAGVGSTLQLASTPPVKLPQHCAGVMLADVVGVTAVVVRVALGGTTLPVAVRVEVTVAGGTVGVTVHPRPDTVRLYNEHPAMWFTSCTTTTKVAPAGTLNEYEPLGPGDVPMSAK